MLRYSLYPFSEIKISDLQLALISYILSIQLKEGFIIRVEDLNRNNSLEDREQEHLDVLKKFSIKEELVVHQSENLKIYQELAFRLLKDKKAFACFCKTSECTNNCASLPQKELQELKSSNQEFVIKLKKPIKNIKIDDIVQKEILFSPDEIGEVTILKSDGFTTEVFASAIDDMSMAISKVISTSDKVLNSAREVYIRNELGFNDTIKYAHIPNIIFNNPEQNSLKYLLKEGILADTIINYLLSINHNKKREIFYLPDAINWYNISEISSKSIEFNIDDLKELNKEHLKRMDSKKLSSIVGFADEDIGDLLKIFLENSFTINDLERDFKTIFEPKDCNKCKENIAQNLATIISKAPMIENFSDFLDYLSSKSSLDIEQVTKAVSLLLTNSIDSNLELEKVYNLIKPYLLEVARCR